MARSLGTPVLTRRHELGTGSARSLLLTILGEFVLPRRGPVWTSALLRLLGELGVEEKAARQTLMRTADDGWISATRLGRRTRWQLTPAGEQLLEEGTRRIFSFAGANERWDSHWLLVAVAVPEGNRALRQQLRTRMSWAGFGSLPGGVWVSPWPGRREEVEDVLERLGLLKTATTFLATAYGNGQDLVRQAWDLDEIEASYEEFLALVTPLCPSTDLEALVCQARLVQEWRRFPLLDPGLPRELLPEQWSGTRAAALFHRRHERWAPRAAAAWHALDED